MAGGKFLGWILDKVPNVWKKFKEGKRAKQVDKIDNAVDTGNTDYINDQLRDVEKRYKRESKGNS
jgi:hypothetical protein